MGAFQLVSQPLVLALFLGQIAEQLPDAGVAGLLGGLLVKTLGLQFHLFDVRADRIQSQGPGKPDWLSLYKALHIVPTNERDLLTVFLPVQRQEPMPMPVLLRTH